VSYILSKDNTRLFYTIDHAPHQEDQTDRCGALIIHGFGDHCQRYDQFTQYLNGLGVDVFRFDYRGHGRSEGKRGHILSFEEYLQDLSAALSTFEAELSPQHKFLFAHSNGGLIAAHALALLPELSQWSGAVLSSPFFAIKVRVPWWKQFLGSKLSAIIPTLQLPTELNASHMSHDQEVIDRYGTDPLIGRVASARWFTEILQAHEMVPKHLSEVKIPLLMQLAGDDLVADSDYAETVFNEITSSKNTLHRYDGLYHEIWFEENSLNRKVFADLDHFIQNNR